MRSCCAGWGPILAWRGDRVAGGGAMLSLGYHMFDLVIWMLGLPETVYCVAGTGHGRPPETKAEATAYRQPEQPVYDTEDTAAVLFRYRDKVMAPVTVSRCFSPVSESLTVFGQAGSITAGPDGCVLRDRDGATLDTFTQQEPPAAVFARQADAFVRAAAEQAPRYECSGWENLLTMAAVEAAYLSDQTGQPESPAELLARYDVEPGDCLKFAPIEENRK